MLGSEFRWSSSARTRVLSPYGSGCWSCPRRIVGAGLKNLEFGWPIGMPLCRALGGGLFELRLSLRSRRVARVIVCVHDGELFALHGFIKKTQKTPDGDLKLARTRKRQLEKTR